MNHWHTVGLVADDHRADLHRAAAAGTRLTLARNTMEPRAVADDPDTGKVRRWVGSLRATIRARSVRRRPASAR